MTVLKTVQITLGKIQGCGSMLGMGYSHPIKLNEYLISTIFKQ